MAKVVTTYVTDDGKRFTNEAAAAAHEKRAKYMPEIEKYLETVDMSTISERAREAQRTRIANSLVGFLAYKDALSPYG